MDGFTVAAEEDEGVVRGENEDSRTCIQVHTKHRRSKSASDRNSNLSKGVVSSSNPKGLNLSPGLPASKRKCSTSNTIHEYPIDNTDTAANHRASLEKDVEKLQLRLQQEKSMRILLERAMGRASSTLSPGHRHVATQTKELIAEIESLEEEVADREQRVLSLYRSIFENCASRPLSEQNSGITSPAHTKINSRKHPSIISSAFCSSKKFPLPPFRALSTINDSGKRNVLQSKTRHASLLSGGKANTHSDDSCFDHVKDKEHQSTAQKTSVLRTLKDHLYQCPSKLSEEMVRCMAAVYCWLRSSTSSGNTEQNRSPLLSRSSTSVVLPQRGGIGDSCKSMVEISWISTDENNFSHASYAINNYRVLVEQLEKVNLNQMEVNGRTAFWINIYNSLVMHAYLAYGIPNNSIRRLALFHKAAYKIGGHVISANAIEQSIFCFRTPRVGRWLETILSAALRKKSGEERHRINLKFGLKGSQSLVCFTLCTGAFSDPVLKVYTGLNIKEELEVAKKEFLEANIVVKKSRKVFLPKLLEKYAKESSIASDDLLKWVTENVDKKLRDLIKECADSKTGRKSSQIIEWLPYNSRFRYVFSKHLTEKPWWL